MLSFGVAEYQWGLYLPDKCQVKYEQKGHTGHEQLLKRRKSCSKVRTLFFNGNKATVTFSITV